MSENQADKIRSFSNLIQNLEDGRLDSDISRDMNNAIEKLNSHYEDFRGTPSAELTLKIKITKDGINMDTKADYQFKTPKTPRTRTPLFCTQDNMLTKRNPNQRELPFRDITESQTNQSFRSTN